MKHLVTALLLATSPFTSIANDLLQWRQAKTASNATHHLIGNQAYKNGKDFSINTTRVKTYKVNDNITVNISPDENYLAKITKVKHKSNGIQHIIGEISHQGEITPIVMTIGEKQFFFRIVTANNVLVGQGVNGQGKLINEQMLSKANNSNISDVKLPQQSNTSQQNSSQQYSNQQQINQIQPNLHKHRTSLVSSTTRQISDEMVTVSVLFVYSLSAETLYQGDVFTRLNHLVEVTNQIYLDSEVNMQIEIADTLAIDYSDDILSDQALDDMTYQSHEVFSNIENIRFEAGADMVALLRPSNDADPVCGLAWGNSDVNNNINYMYSHTSIDCPDYVNAHELGHNMGLAHSLDQGNEGYSYPFARGYRISDPDNGFSTVMAYSASNAGKVYKFSNPEVLCTELACGIDRNDTVNGADASYALNQLRFQLANIMDSEPNLTLASEALNEVVSSGLKDCLENQINNYGITYAAQVRNLFCSYRNISSLQGIENFSGLTSLYLDGNNLTDISQLGSLSKLSTLSLSNTNIADLSPLSSISYLNNLTLSSNQIAALTGLENLNFLTYLNLNDNKINNISAISNNLALETILLENNQITDITPLQNLANVNWLSLNNNQITVLPSLSQLTKLTNFNITDNELIDINGLNALRQLEYLDIENTNTTDLSPIQSLINLKTLTISNNPLENLDSIIYSYNLTTLNATNTNITDLKPLFNLHNNWSQIRLFNSNNIYCWQVNYIDQFINYENYQQPNSCDDSEDNQDFDNDGTSNLAEITNNTNPLYDNEEAGSLEFQVASLSITETEQTIEFKVIRTAGNMGQIKVDVRAINQAAIAGEDFSAVNQTLNFSDKELFKTFNIDIIGDNIYENNETFEVELLNPESASLGEISTLTVTLQDEGGVALTWGQTFNEVNENANTLTLTVTRPGDSIGEMSVDINFLDNTAINGVDYIFENQTVTFLEGEFNKVLVVDILDNDVHQENRSFTLEMTNPVNAYIEENTQNTTIEIIDDDTPPIGIINVEASSLSFNENDGEVSINLQRVNGEFGDIVIHYDLVDITTTQGSDYTLSSGTLTFQDGETEKNITLSISDDSNDESDETFTITLTADDMSIIGALNEVTITIVDNDETVIVTPPPTTASEESSSSGGGALFYLVFVLILTQIMTRKVF